MRNKIITTIYSLIFTLIILPYGQDLTRHLYIFEPWPLGLIWYICVVISPILLILNIILSIRNNYLKKWWKIYFTFLLFNCVILISNKVHGLSALANLGYIHIMLPDLLLRGGTMIFCYYLIYVLMKLNYEESDWEEGKSLILTFGITQLLIYIIVILNLWLVLIR